MSQSHYNLFATASQSQFQGGRCKNNVELQVMGETWHAWYTWSNPIAHTCASAGFCFERRAQLCMFLVVCFV